MSSPTFDLVIRNALVATASDTFTADIGVSDGRIAQLGAGLAQGAREIDAAGRVVTPGGVDAHCHLDQPMEAPARTATSTSRWRRRRAWPTTSTAARARRPAAAPPR